MLRRAVLVDSFYSANKGVWNWEKWVQKDSSSPTGTSRIFKAWIVGEIPSVSFSSAVTLGTNVYQMRNAAGAIKIPAIPAGFMLNFTLPNLAVSGMASSVMAYTSPSSGGFGDMYVTYQSNSNAAATQTVQYAIYCRGNWS